MIISRRNLLYSLGSIGITAAVPALNGCCKRKHPWGDPHEVRVLLEGAWILRSTANTSYTMQVTHCLFDKHECHFGLWSDKDMVDHTGKAGTDRLTNTLPWTMSWAQKPSSTFQTVVNACKHASAVCVNDAAYTVTPDPAGDFILDLPIPDSVDYALGYSDSSVKYGSATLTPHMTLVLHYKVPARGHVIFQTGADFPDVGNQLSVAAGNDVVFRMMYNTEQTTQMTDDPCAHVKMVFAHNIARIVDRNTQKQSPDMQLNLATLRLNSTPIGNISISELGDINPGEATTCPVRGGFVLTSTTLANCLGGNITVGDGGSRG